MIDFIKEYLENRLQLTKLYFVNIAANITAKLVSSFLIAAMVLTIVFMLNMALAYFIGDYYKNTALGFVIVGGIYIVIFIIYVFFAKNSIDVTVKNKIVQSVFTTDEEQPDTENET